MPIIWIKWMNNPDHKIWTSYSAARANESSTQRCFRSPRNQASTQSFKDPFSEHTWTLHLHAGLSQLSPPAEYRLGAVCVIHVRECNSNQRSFQRPGAPHATDKYVQRRVGSHFLLWNSGAKHMLNANPWVWCWIKTYSSSAPGSPVPH